MKALLQLRNLLIFFSTDFSLVEVNSVQKLMLTEEKSRKEGNKDVVLSILWHTSC